jgi:hypothetical protein
MILDDIGRAQRLKKVEADHFIYTATWNTLGANAVTPVNVPIQNDSDFIIRWLALCAYTAAGTALANPDYLVTIFDTGSGRQFQDQMVHVSNTFGTAQWPFVLPEPKLVKGGSVIQVTLTNNTAVAARVDVALIGFKLFYLAGFTREALGTI